MIRELLQETYQALRQNKLRTALSGLAVAWGILMLIVLLGATNGIIHAFNGNAAENSDNTIRIWGGRTSLSYGGLKEGRSVQLKRDDGDALGQQLSDNVSNVSTQSSQSVTLVNGDNHIDVSVESASPASESTWWLKVQQGRFINEADMSQRRKVAVISQRIAMQLFPKTGAIGRTMQVGGLPFTVVGVVGRKGDLNSQKCGIPATTFYTIFASGAGNVQCISLQSQGLDSELKNRDFELLLRRKLATRHNFRADDQSALWIDNQFLNRLQSDGAMAILRLAMWVVGILTMLSGIVGVSNIMFISVHERTHEIGIRRALGAKPRHIYLMVIMEALAITAIFGYVGLVCGVAVTEIAAHFFDAIEANEFGFKFMENPTVGLDIAIEATMAMIAAGTVAGIFPAYKATKINPVESLNRE